MKIGTIDLGERPVFLAPMEDVTDISFRLMCKRFGADMVYTEFVSADALIRSVNKTQQKLNVADEERPVAIQIYGRDVPTMVEAAQIAQATEFISAKPDGYDEEIAQGGTNVSGGQKQRLSIARAIAARPEILIFDDSFSALDYKTDSALRKALHEQVSDSTILIVAQRISTILHADQIIVLDEGRIVGKGTHEELLKTCEVYQQIATSQLSKEELEK